MKLGVVVKQAKPQYGPIADAIKQTGISILSLEDQAKFNEYDYLIVFYNKVPNIINRPKEKIAWWMNDFRTPNQLPVVKSFNFDTIFICHKTYDKEYIRFFNKPLYYMPQCGHSWGVKKGRDINWMVSFLGKIDSKKIYHKDRDEILKKIGSKFPLKIITGEGQTWDQCWIYNQTKFNLSISYSMIEGTSNRLYNILASKGFALVRYYPGIEKQFENHKHLVWWNTVEEALDIISFYNNRENQEKYHQIRQEGYELYKEKHLAIHRLNNMFDIMKGNETQFRGYL